MKRFFITESDVSANTWEEVKGQARPATFWNGAPQGVTELAVVVTAKTFRAAVAALNHGRDAGCP